MNIVLDSALEKIIPRCNMDKPIEEFLENFKWGLDKVPNKEYLAIGSTVHHDNCDGLQKGFIGMLSRAYSFHEKIEIAPHDIWYLVLSEIALIINENTEACRPLFTTSSEKIEISVPCDDVTQIDLEQVVNHLKRLIPIDVSIFVPEELSTLTPDVRIAMYAALCDGVKQYYSYSTFCCGIPEIKLTGNEKDWNSLLLRATTIASLFLSVGLVDAVEYMIRIGDTIEKIQKSFKEIDTDFWKGIFTSKNVGSGGELLINGWITDLFYKKRDLNKIENFMTSVSIVPYKNLDTGRNFVGVYGAFERLRQNDDFIKAGYGSLIYEIVEVVPENQRESYSDFAKRYMAK